MNTEKRIEIVNAETNIPKLTITPERITMKFPIGYPHKDILTKRFLEIAEEHKDLPNSLRMSVIDGMKESILFKGGGFVKRKSNKEPNTENKVIVAKYAYDELFKTN